MANNKDASFSKKFKYDQQQDEYVFQLKKKRSWWWLLWLLLLLLLALLLLIPCHHDLTVKTVSPEGDPIPGVSVTLDYDTHMLYDFDEQQFLYNKANHLEQETDSEGQTVFRNLKCSVFSYVFYCLSKERITCNKECYATTEVEKNFHFTRKVTVEMNSEAEEVPVQVVDAETGDKLSNATVYLSYASGGGIVTDSLKTNANGRVTIDAVSRCDILRELKGSCYGYADTAYTNVPVVDLIAASDTAFLKLRPIKKKFTFFVYNVETKQPIPGAHAEVTLTDPHSHVTRGSSTTNVDGKGMGFFEDAFMLAKIDIKASKENFYDSVLVGDYTVDQFVKLPDDQRIVWLRPGPFVVEYINVDSISHLPIPGVVNQITVTDPSGNVTNYEEVSNANGKFPVTAKEGCKVHIVSKLDPDFKAKETDVDEFGKEVVIPMSPNFLTLTFRTIEAEVNKLLPDCELEIFTSGPYRNMMKAPTNSGSGEFKVSGVFPSDCITIIAKKAGFATNDTKIDNAKVVRLSVAAQEARDIPMTINLPPCDGGKWIERKSEGDPMNSEIAVNLGKRSGTFTFEIDAYEWADEFIVYDGPNSSYPVAYHGTVQFKKTITVSFHNAAVVIRAISCKGGSYWKFMPHCPE